MKLSGTAFVRAAIVSAIAGTTIAASTGPANADAYNYWGAMAISTRTGNTSYAIDYSSSAAAATAAVNACGAADCRWVVYFANGCGAVAQAPDLSWGWGWGSSLSIAKSRAINGAPGRGARIVNWACTTGHQ